MPHTKFTRHIPYRTDHVVRAAGKRGVRVCGRVLGVWRPAWGWCVCGERGFRAGPQASCVRVWVFRGCGCM